MAGENGASTSRLLNSLQYDAANKATLTTTLATGDLIPFADVSADYAIKFATADEIRAAQRLSQTPVVLTATGAITMAAHEGRPLLMGASGAALTFTLPAATGLGSRYLFAVSVVNTSNYLIKVPTGSQVMKGTILGASTTDSATDAARTWASGTTDDTITLNGTTTGGVKVGDWIEFIDMSATFWFVRGFVTQSGSEATMFSDTVT